MDALSDRNLTTPTYDENKAIEVVAKIRTDYFPALRSVYRRLSSELN